MSPSRLLLALPLLLLSAAQTPQDAAPLPPVRGIVVDETGQPLGGVRWWISGNETLQDGQWVVTHFLGLAKVETTGADGRFELPCRAETRYDLDFDADGFTPAFLQELESGADVRIVMRRGFTVSGRVFQRVDGEARPLGFVQVEMRRPNERGLWFTSQRTTDLEGRFTFDRFLPAGSPDQAGYLWQAFCAGATLDLDPTPSGPIDDLRVEISITHGGR